jgi:hypothetical protein
MKRFLIVAAICVIAAPALAGSDLLPVKGIAGARAYDLVSGQQTPLENQTRAQGPSIWAATTSSGYFWGGQGEFEIYLDWGDIATGAAMGGFGFSYATNADPGFDTVMMFYNSENGRNKQPKFQDLLAAFRFTGLAGTATPANRTLFWGWIYSVELGTPIILNGADLDNDLLTDFGYTAWWDWSTFNPGGPVNQVVGPRICGDPNVDLTATGIEDVFELYNDPNYIPAPGYVDPNLTHYVGAYWFGGVVFAQFYMELFAPGCPNRGDSGRYCEADIAGFDCRVGLADLAQLLGNYGCTTGCTVLMGDVDPYDEFFPGDGVIGLGDLAELLGQYGDDCNLP